MRRRPSFPAAADTPASNFTDDGDDYDGDKDDDDEKYDEDDDKDDDDDDNVDYNNGFDIFLLSTLINFQELNKIRISKKVI